MRSPGTQSTVGRELRRLLLELSMAGGGLVGFFWSFPSLREAPTRCLVAHRCFAEVLSTTIVPLVIAMTGGILLGGLLGLLVLRVVFGR